MSQAEDGWLTTELQDFGPTGRVRVRVYQDPAQAERHYESEQRTYERREEDQDDAIAAEETGWWDHGASLEWVRVLDPDDYVLDDFEISRLDVSQAALHGNLVVAVSLDALAPTDDTAEALAVLREIAAALVDETVEHLTRTED